MAGCGPVAGRADRPPPQASSARLAAGRPASPGGDRGDQAVSTGLTTSAPAGKLLLGGDISISIMLVTPALAMDWLDVNFRNRSVNARDIDRINRDLLAGEFEFLGDPIRFGKNGELYDGQHRLF